MPIGNMWQHTSERVNEVAVCAWIKVRRSNRARRMSYEDGANAVLRMCLVEVRFYVVGDVNDLIFALGCDGECFHVFQTFTL